MERLEGREKLDRASGDEIELPEQHFEGLGTNNPLRLEAISSNVYQKEVEGCKGLRDEWSGMKRGNSEGEFNKAYRDYVLSPKELAKNDPEAYKFLRDRVFWGKEYKAQAESEEKPSEKINEKAVEMKEGTRMYSSTMGTFKPSNCDLTVSHGGTIDCS